MKISRITTIKNYKSFLDFSWAKFCKNASSQEEVFSNFSIVFGENGAGKSAICDVLKSVSRTQDFQNNKPILAAVEIKNGRHDQIYKYEKDHWDSQLDKNKFLFFDIDFVNANVHTHGIISSNLQRGAHTQRAGKLIIDLDEQADELKNTVQEKKNELETFQKLSEDILSETFTDKEQKFYRTYKKAPDKAKNNLKTGQDILKELESDLITLSKLNSKYAEIGRLAPMGKIAFHPRLSSGDIYIELFNRQIKEKSQDEADEKIKAHFEKHKQFIELAKEQISQNYKNENCPLCMQPLANASKVIEYYRTVFDRTYEIAKRKYISDIQNIKNELDSINSELTLLPSKVITVFDILEKVKNDFEIINIYKLDEKTEWVKKFKAVSLGGITDLLAALESLKGIDRKRVDIEKNYDALGGQLNILLKDIDDFNKVVEAKNKSITDFKSKYSNQNKIREDIQKKGARQAELAELIAFLKSNKIRLIKNQNEAVDKQKQLSDELKKAQEVLENYLEKAIPESIIAKMIAILGKFNLSFSLEHIKPDSKTKDYSFSFKIKDQKGNEREFKDGLSEGERQLISLAFFFSINENLHKKDDIVLIFDDPITSLDSPNLKILAELIHKKTEEFAQVIVFTHHPLFFKYLAKCEKPNPCKFGILKNADAFGGSFMFTDPGFELTAEIRKCNQEINQNAQNGNLRPEEIALKYGQLLRLAIERFIKNELLMWDKEKNFSEVTESLKRGKNRMLKLSDGDLEVMIDMYKYCNYSNLLHADKESPSALSELTTHIDKFIEILDKANI